MWFLVRALFWLSLVFLLLPWPKESTLREISDALRAGAGAAIVATLEDMRAGAMKACAQTPENCFKAAAELGALASSAAGAIPPASKADARAEAAPQTPRR